MTRAQRIARVAGVVVIVAVAALGIRWLYQHSRGVEVRMRNVATSPLRSMTVIVTGRSYAVGDLPAGATRSVWVEPTSESNVEISFTTSTGEAKRQQVHGYVEPGNSGWISVDLTDGDATNIQSDIDLY